MKTNKIFYAGSEIYGFYVLHLNGSISDNHGLFYKSFEEANFYCGLGDSVFPKFKEM